MTKVDVVKSIQDKIGLTKKDISKVVDDVFELMNKSILESQGIKLSGFGNFEVKERGRRVGRNPKTGEEKIIEPRTVVVFRPSQLFKTEVNE